MLIYEKSVPGRRTVTLPERDVPEHLFDASLLRKDPPFLPEVAEIDLVRHYTELSRKAMGVDNCFYPLGSCTMKYNPKLNEVVARNPSFAGVHPLQPEGTVQGTLEVMYKCSEYLADITGMDAMCLQPAAGAQGEYSSLQTIRKYHLSRGDTGRTKVIVPDSAHGTNPASAAMCGFDVINVKSDKRGNVDLRELRKVLGPDTAALMLTNPNTLGLLDENILKITSAVHRAGGLVYYDGANLNAVMGIMRPGDLGFDVVHLNLHKTFSSPHGGGGPGSGPIGCRKKLEKFLPGPRVAKKRGRYVLTDAGPESIGRVKAFYGNIAVVIRAYAYILTLGADGIRESAELSVLNANYLKKKLEPCFRTRFDRPCMHEFVLSLEEFHKKTGVSAADVAKALIDYGIHPPTIYFPLIVHEALMFEPTETESRETLDRCAEVMREIYERALKDPEDVKACPKTTVIGRPDEVLAARHPVLRYSKE